MLKYLLGVEVVRSKQGNLLSQWKYVLNLFSETKKLGVKPCKKKLGVKPCSTLMTPNL